MSNKVIVVGIYHDRKEGSNMHKYLEFEIDDMYNFSVIEKRIHHEIGDTKMKAKINAFKLADYSYYDFYFDGVDYMVRIK